MSKVFLSTMAGDYLHRNLIGDGKLLKFNISGLFLGEYPIDFSNTGTLQEVDIVSVLFSKGQVELGFNTNQQFTKRGSLLGLADIARKLNSTPGLIFTGQRQGNEGNNGYSQYIYVFHKDHVNTANF